MTMALYKSIYLLTYLLTYLINSFRRQLHAVCLGQVTHSLNHPVTVTHKTSDGMYSQSRPAPHCAAAASTAGPGRPVPDKYAFQAILHEEDCELFVRRQTSEQTDKQMVSPSRIAPAFAAGALQFTHLAGCRHRAHARSHDHCS